MIQICDCPNKNCIIHGEQPKVTVTSTNKVYCMLVNMEKYKSGKNKGKYKYIEFKSLEWK